jgi:hypothetical protein
VNNAILNEPCIWDTSLNAEDENRARLRIHFCAQTECFLFLFRVIQRLITPAVAAIFAEHAKTNSSSSAFLKRGQFLVFRIKSNT